MSGSVDPVDKAQYEMLSGIHVLEVATQVFAPIAATLLAEWGADTIKVEEPVGGDAYRGMVTSGVHKTFNGVDPSFQFVNRGKRSVGIDLKNPEGMNVLRDLIRWCDVFITNFLPHTRTKLGIDVEDIRALNPGAIYVRATGQGVRGPDAAAGGYDSTSYYARTGFGVAMTAPDVPYITAPRPAFGDVVGGMAIAGAVSAALVRRERSGEAAVVDVSLLATGMWQLQSDIVHAHLDGHHDRAPVVDRFEVANPVSNFFRTKDGRFLRLSFFEADRHWANFCTNAGADHLLTDERFATMETRREHAGACVEALDELFADRTLAEWAPILDAGSGVWSAALTAGEVPDDPQVLANHYLRPAEMGNGTSLDVVMGPAQFDEEVLTPTRAPELGEHTEDVLLGLGYTWERLGALKSTGAIT